MPPVELVDNIAQHLDTAALGSFRLTCKDLLDRLRTLGNSPQLGQYVQRLVVTGEDTLYGKGITWNRNPDGHLVDPLYQDRVQQLQRILKSCVNCTFFRIDDCAPLEDEYEDQFLTRSDVLTILLNIIADTGLPTTSFMVDLTEENGSGLCGFDPRRLSNLPDLHGRNFVSAWAHVREFMLGYQMEFRVAVDMGIAFIQHAPSLQKLSMSFDHGQDAGLFLRRLVHVDALRPPTRLHEIALKSATVSGDDLATLVDRVGHGLRVVSFRSIRLTSGSRARWRWILETLRDRSACLDTIYFCWNRNEPRAVVHFPMIGENPVVGAGSREFEFRKKYHCGPGRVVAAKYSGPRMDVALQMLIDSMECVNSRISLA